MSANAILRTQTIRPENAAEFVKRYLADNVMYCAIGRETNPIGLNPDTGSPYSANDGMWGGTDTIVDAVVDTYAGDKQFWSMVIGAQKFIAEDIFLVVPYVPQVNFFSSTPGEFATQREFNEIYSTGYLTNGKFFLINDMNEVFICLQKGGAGNGANGKATQIPKIIGATAGTLQSDTVANNFPNGFFDDVEGQEDPETSIVDNSLVDGYIWKYLYTVKRSFDKETAKWLPVNYAVNTQSSGTGTAETYSSSQDRHIGPTGEAGTAYRILGARYVYLENELSAGVDSAAHDALPVDSGINYRQTALVSNPYTVDGNRASASVILAKNTVNDDTTYPIADTIKIDIDKGDIFYIENHPLINRISGQSETFNTVISF